MPKFTPHHEWIAVHGNFATIGIAEYALEQLGELVFVELPKLGRSVVAGECAAVVEQARRALPDRWIDGRAGLSLVPCNRRSAQGAQPD